MWRRVELFKLDTRKTSARHGDHRRGGINSNQVAIALIEQQSHCPPIPASQIKNSTPARQVLAESFEIHRMAKRLAGTHAVPIIKLMVQVQHQSLSVAQVVVNL